MCTLGGMHVHFRRNACVLYEKCMCTLGEMHVYFRRNACVL